MGLTVMLDAHTDILTEFSVSSDFEGFTAILTPPGFNFTKQFALKPAKAI
jgi:hypothetical protein